MDPLPPTWALETDGVSGRSAVHASSVATVRITRERYACVTPLSKRYWRLRLFRCEKRTRNGECAGTRLFGPASVQKPSSPERSVNVEVLLFEPRRRPPPIRL